jgi:hypothetical protein
MLDGVGVRWWGGNASELASDVDGVGREERTSGSRIMDYGQGNLPVNPLPTSYPTLFFS